MKTARFISLLIGLGMLTQGVSLAEPSTQAAPKAPAQKVAPEDNHSGKGEEGKLIHSKTEAPVTGHPNNKPDEKHSAAENTTSHDAKAHQPGAASHGQTTGHASGPTGGKTAGNVPNKVTPVNASAQHQASLSKPAGAANSGPKKPGNSSVRPVAASANKLPTSPTVNTGRSRAPALATIGGPAKPTMGSTASISGTGIKSKP